MKLYHGSNIIIDNIDLSMGKCGKDFGRGFYLSDNYEQALKMAKVTAFRSGKGEPMVTEFLFDDSILKKNIDINIKIFSEYNKEWAEFILENRRNSTTSQVHNHDIVIGPIADDTVGVQIRRFTLGYITIETLVKELSYIKPTIQYFFGTQKSITLLKKL